MFYNKLDVYNVQMFKFRFWPVVAGKANSKRVERGECSSCIAPTRSPRQPAAC